MEKKILNHFKSVDPILYQQAVRFQDLQHNQSSDHFVDLIESIVSQQLSGKAASTIFGRFTGLFPERKVTPEHLLSLLEQDLRRVGLSGAKARYVQNVATAAVTGAVDFQSLHMLSDDDVIARLVQIKGVGRWTAEMFLMFSLGREDVFSTGDLGLVNAVVKLFGLKQKPTAQELLALSAKWSPYRTWAARVLWKSLDTK